MEENRILEMRGIEKSFPGVRALRGVDFSLNKGEIHALMGENGAGKSTLIKVLTGVYSKDNGTISMPGADDIQIHSPQDAQNA
ncbi:MAG: ATP-binding cassette domain-containing protein, partial [Lachnospiraceae bacterium]|nr:ATP-binding cassette domain-containing protein [Lachnospiraceae bacterium]